MLDELAVSKGMVEDLVLLVNGFSVGFIPQRVNHTEFNISPEISWLVPE